jgi:hypothetical protein
MKKFVERGDVLKSNPIPGFWTASVVLATQPKTTEFVPMCLIGGTLCVFQHDFRFPEIDLAILKVARGVSGFDADRPMISVYASRLKAGVEVVGHVKVAEICDRTYELKFSRNDMPEWPMRGSLGVGLGSSSIDAWRSLYDKERWILDMEAARRSHLEMIQRLKIQANEKRNKNKA